MIVMPTRWGTRVAASLLAGLGIGIAACDGAAPSDASAGVDAGAPADAGDPALPERPELLSDELRELIEQHVARARAAPRDASAHGTLGLVYEANHLWPEARASFEQASRLGNDPLWILHAAIAQERVGDLDAALAGLGEGLRRHPDFAPMLARLGDLALQLGDLARARDAYRAASELAPRAPEPLVGLAEIELAESRPEIAIELLERALALDDTYRTAHYLLGVAFGDVGRESDARRELAIGADSSKRPMPDAGLGRLAQFAVGASLPLRRSQRMLNEGRAEEAAALLEPWVQRRPDNVRLLLNFALARFHSGRTQEGLELLARAEELDPAFHLVPMNLAGCLLQLGRAQEALPALDRALLLAPDFAPSHYLRGRALMELRRDGEAREALEQAERRAPSDVNVQLALAELCERGGDGERAREHCRRALELAPGHPAATELAGRLEVAPQR